MNVSRSSRVRSGARSTSRRFGRRARAGLATAAVAAAMLVSSMGASSVVDDPFTGTAIDRSKGSDFSQEGAVSPAGELVAATTERSFSRAAVRTRYRLLGDFDIQVDYRIVSGWSAPIDNITVSAGVTSHRSCSRPTIFQRGPESMVGGAPTDYLLLRNWGPDWKSVNPLDAQKRSGRSWLRVGVTTVSSQPLRDTPPEWAGLSVSETAARLDEYAYQTTKFFMGQGLHVEIHDVGNEIDFGILNVRPGERIPQPPGIDDAANVGWMPAAGHHAARLVLERDAGATGDAGVRRQPPPCRPDDHASAGQGGTPGRLANCRGRDRVSAARPSAPRPDTRWRRIVGSSVHAKGHRDGGPRSLPSECASVFSSSRPLD
jgi:hypothetical protein